MRRGTDTSTLWRECIAWDLYVTIYVNPRCFHTFFSYSEKSSTNSEHNDRTIVSSGPLEDVKNNGKIIQEVTTI